MWALWQRFDARRTYTEREVNAVLNTWATYGDHATLRRELINMKLLGRKPDCSEYWKEPVRASDEVRAFFEDPASLELEITSVWRPLAGLLWRAASRVMDAVGQLRLPLT